MLCYTGNIYKILRFSTSIKRLFTIVSPRKYNIYNFVKPTIYVRCINQILTQRRRVSLPDDQMTQTTDFLLKRFVRAENIQTPSPNKHKEKTKEN